MKNCNFFINLINNPISLHKDSGEHKKEYLKLLQAKQNTNLIINEPKEIIKIFNKDDNSKKCFSFKDLKGFNKFELYDFIFTKNFPYQSTSFLTNIIRGNQAKIKHGCKTVTNTFFILGSKESGKSTLLRGENILSDKENLKNEGIMLSIMKEAYKLCLNSVNDKNCLILIKLGIVVLNDGKIYNLIDLPGKGTKNYFDECFINEKSETLIYIKHFKSLRDISFEIEKSLKRREEILDLNWDNRLIYHFVLEIKNKNQETLLNLQFDFFEFNYNFSNQGMEDIKYFIDGFLMKSFNIENSFLLERLLFRNISNVDYTNYINFILCLKNYDIDINRIFKKKLSENNYIKYFEEQVLKEMYGHINLLNHFKNILARKDLINLINVRKHVNSDESNQKHNCEYCNAYETSVIHNKKYQLELIEEMNKLTFDLEMIHSHIRDLNLNKKTLIANANANANKSPTRNLAENKKIEKLYKTLSYDSVKLEKLIKDLDEVFKRTQTNISSIKSFCIKCNDCKK